MIYELFSHKVYSLYMFFAFVLQLLGGFVPSTIMYALKVKRCRAAADGHTITLADGTVLK